MLRFPVIIRVHAFDAMALTRMRYADTKNRTTYLDVSFMRRSTQALAYSLNSCLSQGILSSTDLSPSTLPQLVLEFSGIKLQEGLEIPPTASLIKKKGRELHPADGTW